MLHRLLPYSVLMAIIFALALLTSFSLPAPATAGSCVCNDHSTVDSRDRIKASYGPECLPKQKRCDISFSSGDYLYTGCYFIDGDTCNIPCGSGGSDLCEFSAQIKNCKQNSDCAANIGIGICKKFSDTADEPGFCFINKIAQSAPIGLNTTELHPPLLEFHLPGLSFTDVKNTLDSDGYIYLPYIGELIAAIYKFGMVVGSILAAVMIIMSGVRVILSAGGEAKTEGYKRIGEIIVGLVIMWGSYAIIYNINPDLVNFKALKIKYIEKKDFDGSEAGSEKPSGTAGDCGGAVTGRTQTLATDVGLSGAIFPYVHYSSKFGDTCKKPVAIKGITLHYTVTDATASPRGVVRDWSDPQSRGSICQIIVDPSGQAYQVTEKLDEHVICQGGSSGFNLNNGGIGIEIMGMNENDLLANGPQKRAVIELVKKLAAKYGIETTNKVDNLLNTASGSGIFTHHQITRCEGAPNTKDDPGETYAKQIIEGAGGTYIDWQADARCKK